MSKGRVLPAGHRTLLLRHSSGIWVPLRGPSGAVLHSRPHFPKASRLPPTPNPLLLRAAPWPMPSRGHRGCNSRLPVGAFGAGGVQRDFAPLAFLVPIFPFAFFSALKQASFLRSHSRRSLASGKRKRTFPGIGGPFRGRDFLGRASCFFCPGSPVSFTFAPDVPEQRSRTRHPPWEGAACAPPARSECGEDAKQTATARMRILAQILKKHISLPFLLSPFSSPVLPCSAPLLPS